MKNSMVIDIFRNNVNLCLNINENISNNYIEYFDLIIKNKKLINKYYFIKKINDVMKCSIQGCDINLLFMKLEINEFKEFIEELKNILGNKLRIVIINNNFNNNKEFDFLKEYFNNNLNKFEIIIKKEMKNLSSILFLMKNFEYKDYLEYYKFESQSKKTLSIFHCLDEDNIIKFDGIKNNRLEHFIYINIDKCSTDFYHFENELNYKHIGNIEIGEYTFWGLIKILDSNIMNINDITNAINDGNLENCDLIVKDIYGGSYSNINLDQDVVASSLAKLQFLDYNKRFNSNDILKSITILLSNLFIQKGLIHCQILCENNIIISGFISNFPKIMAAIYSTTKIVSEGLNNVYFIKPMINLSCIDC